MPSNVHIRLLRWQAEDSANRSWRLESSSAGLFLHLSEGDKRVSCMFSDAQIIAAAVDVLDHTALEMLSRLEVHEAAHI